MRQGFRFASVGVVNTLLGGAVIGLATWLGAAAAAANALGYAVGFAVAFVLHKAWTFGSPGPATRQLPAYVGVIAVAWVLNLLVVLALDRQPGANAYAAQFAGMATYTVVTFVALRRFVFRAAGTQRPRAAATASPCYSARPMPTRAALFDLGNVVLHVDWEPALAHWSARSVHPPAEVRRRFVVDEPFRRHETGHLPAPAYFAHLRETLGLQCDDAHIEAGWNAILLHEIADTLAVIDALRARGVPCHALSNTNATHVDAIRRVFPGLLPRFDRVFVSHEIGHRKPAEPSFRHVLDALALAPAEVLFFDDLQDNVDAARTIGIDAVLVRGPRDVRAAVQDRGLL